MVITINGVSEKSLRNAANKVRAYKNRVIANNREFLKDLAVTGMDEAGNYLTVIASDYIPPDFTTYDPHVYGDGSKGAMSTTLRLKGEQAAFVEFGAGVHYNGNPHGSPHPWGVELGFTIGDYGLHQGLKDGWWHAGHYYHGTPAAMPLYHASIAMKQNARVLAMINFRS